MGRLCKKIGRGIKEALEGGADAVKKALKAVRKKIKQKQKEIDELNEAIDGLKDSNLSEKNKKAAKEAYEELREKAQKELDELEKERRRLENIQTAQLDGEEKLTDIVAALEDQDDQLKQLSFIEASIEIENAIDESFESTIDPESPILDPCDNTDYNFNHVDTESLSELISDTGLDDWARSTGLPLPSSMQDQQALAARIFYGVIAPGMEDMGLQLPTKPCNPVNETIIELMLEAINRTAERPLEELQQERQYQLALPHRINEYALFQMAPGNKNKINPCIDIEASKAEEKLKIKKAFIVGRRDSARNQQLIKGLLAVFGLDFLVEENDDAWDVILQLLIAGEWLKAAYRFAKLIWRLIRRPNLWRRLVRRYGRFGALRFLAGLGGRLVPAVLAGLIAYAWYDIYSEWQEKKKTFDSQLKKLYDESDVENKDDIFKANIGYIPK